MNADERFDRLIHDALAWQAASADATLPSLNVAMHELAERVAPTRPISRPAVVLRPATSTAVTVILLTLLLVALLAMAVFVGSQLQRELPPPPPGPFGFTGECATELPEGVAVEVYDGDRATTILSNGLVYTDLSPARTPTSQEPSTGPAANSRVEAIRATAFGQRQLTERGVALLVERLADAGVTSGCIALRSSASQASITALTPSGFARLSWGPEAGTFGFARRMSPEEEREAAALLAYLSKPETSLPAQEWADATIGRITPERWLVSIQFVPTELPPGAVVGLPNGETLDGTDPRYEQVRLPDGQEPLAFGIEYQPEDVSYLRCGMVESREALRLAKSLDSTFGTETDWYLHTPDMAHEVMIEITPAFPPGHDCDAAWAARVGPPRPSSSASSSPTTSSDVAGPDSCSLLPAAVMLDGRRWTDGQQSERSELALGRPARACWLIDTRDPSYEPENESSAIFARRLTLTLYPANVAKDDAGDIAETVLGHETAETEIADRPVWQNDCLAAQKPCAPLAAFWHGGRLFFVQFHYANLTNPVLPLDEARAQVAAVIEALE